LSANSLQALGWALKDHCYATWAHDPAEAVRAADVLAALAADQGRGDGELDALAAWTGGIADVVRGELTRAPARFDRAAAGLRAVGREADAAQTQVPKIMVLSMLGRHDDAAACGEAALGSLRALGEWRAAGRVCQNLGGVHLRRDDYPSAARCYREAAVWFARSGDPAHSVIADIGLADAQAAMGQFDDALAHYARAGQRARTHGLDMSLALVDESVALVELARGRYREALAGFEAARRRYEQLGLPQMLAIAEKQLGDAYLDLRLLPEALALFDAAVAQFAAQGLPDEQAWALAQRGRALAGLGDGAGAEAAWVAASALFEAQDNAVGAANVALARAERALAEDQVGPALDLARASAQGFAEAQQAGGEVKAEAVAVQALLDRGDADEAVAACAQLLARARALGLRSAEASVLTGQGRLALMRGDRDQARADFETAIALTETQRRALPGDEISAAFMAGRTAPFEHRLRLALDDGDGAEVLRQLERLRAPALGERLARAPDPEGKRERLQWWLRRLQRLHEDADDSRWLDAQVQRTERELLEADRRRRLSAAEDDAAGDDGFDVGALADALPPDTCVLVYGLIDDELFACIVGRGGTRLHRHVARARDVVEAVQALRFQLDALRHGAATLGHRLPQLTARALARLQALQALIVEPLAPALAGVNRLMVVPCGPLAAAPLSALPGLPTLALAPSARVAWRGLQRQPRPLHTVVALGDSGRLAHAGDEARRVAALFPEGVAHVGADATIAALQQDAPRADLLHLACHARFRADNPRFSALLLADGALTVDLAESLDLGPCTVVMSACETGLTAGDEAVGLVRAFLVAGAARVVASLWPVDDRVTAAFMARFHDKVRAGADSADALRAAQQAVAEEFPHPHFWGAFALYGGF